MLGAEIARAFKLRLANNTTRQFRTLPNRAFTIF